MLRALRVLADDGAVSAARREAWLEQEELEPETVHLAMSLQFLHSLLGRRQLKCMLPLVLAYSTLNQRCQPRAGYNPMYLPVSACV